MINPMNILVRAGDYENAKKQIRILANETSQNLRFFDSLDSEDRASFSQDIETSQSLVNMLIALASNVEDPTFQQEISGMLNQYSQQAVPN